MTASNHTAWTAVRAGLAYAAIVFAFAFITGVFRTLLVQGAGLPPLAGVALELPLILVAAWFTWRAIDRRMGSRLVLSDRALTGLVGLAGVLAGEVGVSMLAGGGGISDFFASYQRPEVLLGFVGQLVFALFPLLSRRPSPTSRD